jgi:(E)-4-hydroxy-3-methylbut-2-enyl-diphosphate synthase
VFVGSVGVGGNNPIRLQSMATTPTMDTAATVDQVKRMADAGCEIARITAPTANDAANLEHIKSALLKSGYTLPLVADIHFRPDAAMVAADFVEKVRINPGNFVDGKAFKIREYTDAQYQEELDRLEEKFVPLVLKLKKLKRALRIGTNHGSLSDRIMNRFGDTPMGMVESALEYMRVCEKNGYFDIIFSMKASNPKVMIAAYRLLAQRLDQLGKDYPFHLGVTEAGGGEDGRIKSSIGIGSLLEDGIGDTIRVSLTEDPEFEIPIARELADRYLKPWAEDSITAAASGPFLETLVTSRRVTNLIKTGPIDFGADRPIRVISRVDLSAQSVHQVLTQMEERVKLDTPPEILEISISGGASGLAFADFQKSILTETKRVALWARIESGSFPLRFDGESDGISYSSGPHVVEEDLTRLAGMCRERSIPLMLWAPSAGILIEHLIRLKRASFPIAGGLEGEFATSHVQENRRLAAWLKNQDSTLPLLLSCESKGGLVESSVVLGSLLCDGLGDAVRVNGGWLSKEQLDLSYNLLQGTGNRITKTEYVSCPSCGRTLFDLQTTTERIRTKTGHLKGVKIAIMGCIVNGPGEMADADFGYVGGGPGKINLYVGKQCVEKSIPAEIADEKLVSLIKSHGKWVDPS